MAFSHGDGIGRNGGSRFYPMGFQSLIELIPGDAPLNMGHQGIAIYDLDLVHAFEIQEDAFLVQIFFQEIAIIGRQDPCLILPCQIHDLLQFFVLLRGDGHQGRGFPARAQEPLGSGCPLSYILLSNDGFQLIQDLFFHRDCSFFAH